MLIVEALKLYCTQKRAIGLSDETIGRVSLNVSMLARDTATVYVYDITTDTILSWGNCKINAGTKHSTIYAYYNSIRSFINFLRSHGIRPAVDTKLIRCKPNYDRRIALPPEAVKRVVSHAGPKTSVFIRLLYVSGLRISEAITIHSRHLNDGTTLYVMGKGGKVRPVFVDSNLLRDLQALAAHQGGFCFTDNEGNQVSRSKAYYYVKKAMIAAGFPHCSPHVLRHSFCTELLKRGASLSHTSRLMGHSNVAITETYVHLVTDDIKKAHKLLPLV